jgi:23S rRNA pseudouridine1911/1915/1917 synthase
MNKPEKGGQNLPKLSPPKIIFEDTHLIVVDKPAGWLSQGDVSGEESLVDWLRLHLGRPYVGLVHRLDRGTSGLLVVGKRTKAAARLTESLQSGALKRTYLAVLWGNLEQPARWRHFLVKDEKTNVVRVTDAGRSGAKEAVLAVTPVARHGEFTLARFELETGRSHQIRVQAAREGHPLVGDRKYGANRDSSVISRPALHSSSIEFPHPMGGEILKFESELPVDIQRLLSAREN